MSVEVLLGLGGLFLAIGVPLARYWFVRRHKLKGTYSLIWKNSRRLRPADVLGSVRSKSFHLYYEHREIDNEILDRLGQGKNVLVTGSPLAGKSRAVYEALKHSKKRFAVLRPVLKDVDTVDFRVPRRLALWRKRVLLLDDINKYVDSSSFAYALDQWSRRRLMIVATCGSGPELKHVKSKLSGDVSTLFEEPIEIGKVSRPEAEQVAAKTGRNVPAHFDGNIGSIFVDIEAMKERYRECTDKQKHVLLSVKKLYEAGIYEGAEVFSVDRILLVYQHISKDDLKPLQWQERLDRLKSIGFIEGDRETVRVEETYLQQVISDDTPALDNYEEMIKVFSEDPDALLRLGMHASGTVRFGAENLGVAAYQKASIKAVSHALTSWTRNNSPEKWTLAQVSLGNAYQRLAGTVDKAPNCCKAITAYTEALTVYTRDRFPMGYATTQNNLGIAYSALAEVADRANNSRKAISAFTAALNFYTCDRFPLDYAAVQNNLGAAYRPLAEVEDRADNCRRAITAYTETLTICTHDRYPMQYAMTQSNLGIAYATLAEVEDKAVNCHRAITAHSAALTVHSRDRFPTDYAMTQNNLGNAYAALARIEDKAGNCRKAIAAFQKALHVRTRELFPMQYAVTQNNLGIARGLLAEVEDRADNCLRAREAYQAALEIAREQGLMDLYDVIIRNLARLDQFCHGDQ